MTADHDKTENPAPADVQVDVAAPAPMISRRMLLRGASAAVPTILTLNSGVAAAAAAASNMIAVGVNVPQDFEGQHAYICVNTNGQRVNSKVELGTSNVYYRIPDPNDGIYSYKFTPNGESWGQGLDTTPARMCEDGGMHIYKMQGGQGGTVSLPQGAGGLASAAALTSFISDMGRINPFSF